MQLVGTNVVLTVCATLNFDKRLLVAGVRSGSTDTRHRGAVLAGTKRHATEATGL